MGQDLAYDKNYKFRFGYYIESHEDRYIANVMEGQTVSGICLGPTEKNHWSYKIFSLKMGRVVTRKKI